jgi:hypothetical protein
MSMDSSVSLLANLLASLARDRVLLLKFYFDGFSYLGISAFSGVALNCIVNARNSGRRQWINGEAALID